VLPVIANGMSIVLLWLFHYLQNGRSIPKVMNKTPYKTDSSARARKVCFQHNKQTQREEFDRSWKTNGIFCSIFGSISADDPSSVQLLLPYRVTSIGGGAALHFFIAHNILNNELPLNSREMSIFKIVMTILILESRRVQLWPKATLLAENASP